MKRRAIGLLLALTLVCGETMVVDAARTQSTEREETGYEDLDYIKGRPLTEEELAVQRSHVPEKLENLNIEEDEVLQADLSQNQEACGAMEAVYDSRTLGIVTPVKDQDRSQWCWAYTLMSSAETSMLKNGISTAASAPDLSEAALVYYFYHMDEITDPLNLTQGDYNSYGDNVSSLLDYTGNTRFAGVFLSGWAGVKTDSFYSYEDADQGTEINRGAAYTQNEAVLKDLYYIAEDVNQIKAAVRGFGSVGVAICMDVDRYYNWDTGAYCDPVETDATNHEVTIIGWDDNYDAANFYDESQVKENGAWIVKNSWSTNWGDDGYFYISYEDATLYPMFALSMQSADTYAHNYYYDGSGSTNQNGVYNGGMIANEFTAKGNAKGAERLDAVSFFTASANVNYSIQVYRNLTNQADPMSGAAALATPVTGSTSYAGMYTIALPTSVPLREGERFSVVITLSSVSDGVVYFGVEETWDYDWIKPISQNDANQSFCKNPGQSGWTDLAQSATNECARIKAYTNDIEAHKVTFMDGGTIISQQQVADADAAVTPAYKKDGYLLSWDKAYSKITQDTVLQAVWTPITYQVVFDKNGGKGTMASLSACRYDSAYTLASNRYKRTGYTFLGWNTRSNGKGIWYTNKSKISNLTGKNGTKVKLYAQWSKNVSISSLTSKTGKTLSVKWKKADSRTSGYQIAYSTRSSFSKKATSTVKVTGYKSTGKSIKKLKAGKKYYVKIRGYRKVGKTYYYGKYSKVMTVRTAK